MARTKAFDKDTVLKQAMVLFWQKGFHDTSMDKLVKNLGISRSSIYDTFGNKEQFFIEALNFYLKSTAEKALPPVKRDQPLSDYLHNFLYTKIDGALSDSQSKGCFAVNCTVEMGSYSEQDIYHKVKAILEGNMDNFVASSSKLFQYYKEIGELAKTKKPQQLANFLFASLSSIQLLSRKSPDRQVLEDIAEMTINAIIN